MTPFCAPFPCYLIPWWRRSRPPRVAPSWALNIYAPFRSALRSSRFVLLYVVSSCVSYLSSRSASRSISLCVSFVRFVLRFARRFYFLYRSCVSSCVLSLRFVFPACLWVMAFDMGAVLPCSPLVLSCRAVPLISFRFSIFRLAARLVLRPVFLLARGARPDFHMGAVSSCLPLIFLPCRLVLGVCVPSCMPSLRAVLSVRSCVSPCVLFCVPICVPFCIPLVRLPRG